MLGHSAKDVSDAGQFYTDAKTKIEQAEGYCLATNTNADQTIRHLKESLEALRQAVARECVGGDLAKYDNDQVEEARSEQEESGELPTEAKLPEQLDRRL